MRHCGLGRKWLVDFNDGKSQLILFDQSSTAAIDVRMDRSVFKKKSSSFFSKFDWGSYIISVAKTVSKNIGALICSMKFLSPEVILYLYNSTIRHCMECCCHMWAGATSCQLGLLDKLQKWMCRNVSPSLVLEVLAHSRNLLNRYYFGTCSSQLVQLFPLPYSCERPTRYSDRLHDFSVTIRRCYKHFYVNSFFPRTARVWNSMPRKCFTLIYDLNGFK